MKNVLLVLAFLFLPSIAFAGWSDVFDKLGREAVTETTGVDVTKQENTAQESTPALQRGAFSLACACYGKVQPGLTRANQQCASGVDQIVVCDGVCQGSHWRPSGAICQ
jgi:hypothetical protein